VVYSFWFRILEFYLAFVASYSSGFCSLLSLVYKFVWNF